MKIKALVVDDSLDTLELLERQLVKLGITALTSTNVKDALDLLSNEDPNLIITDIKMPNCSGIELVKFASEHFPDIPILVITGFPSVDEAVITLKSGAVDYLIKPFTNDEFRRTIEEISSRIRLNGITEKKLEMQDEEPMIEMIGNSVQMKKIKKIIKRINNHNATILIHGESGTGKEVIARSIHYSSHNNKSPFIAVNCGGIPESLLESELFGYKKGAFTGATETRMGLFEAANGGTIFLDEIGNASLKVQQGLLRVIQEKEILMVGESRSRKVNVRIIAATNSNLPNLIKAGHFREDLYYRLNVIEIEMPALRERKEDIPDLISYFINKYSKEYNKIEIKLDNKVLEVLMRYNWPGNIRELENVIQRALLLTDTEIMLNHLPDHMKYSSLFIREENEILSLKELEKNHINMVLRRVNNNKTKAAKLLGIDRSTLYQKISSH